MACIRLCTYFFLEGISVYNMQVNEKFIFDLKCNFLENIGTVNQEWPICREAVAISVPHLENGDSTHIR